jgi:phage antirepressor YoqD-like protein
MHHSIEASNPQNNVATHFCGSENVSRTTMSSFDLLDLVNSARAEFGESEVRRADFTARCKDELEGEYYESFVVKNSRGPASEGLRLTKDQCMLISMRESKAVRRAVVGRLNAAEGPRVIATLPDFSNPAAAARAWAEQFELQQIASQALIEAAPKIAFVEKYVEATGSMGFRQVAKLLNANERQFRQMLLDKGVMYYLGGVLTPYSQHQDAERFDVKTGKSETNGHAFSQARFTPKGVQWIAGIWAARQLEMAA